jgi:hypothetical protein
MPLTVKPRDAKRFYAVRILARQPRKRADTLTWPCHSQSNRVRRSLLRGLSLQCGEQTRQNLAHMKTTTLAVKHSMNGLPYQLAILLITIAFALFVLAPPTSAECNVLCDGYNNTAFGAATLFHNTSDDNTAIGNDTLYNNTTGGGNTQRPVLMRSLATQPVPRTRLRVQVGSSTTRPGSRTRPAVLLRSVAIPPATTTRPMVIVRSLRTPLAAETRRTAVVRSIRIQPAATISHWARMPVLTSQRATTISILATPV